MQQSFFEQLFAGTDEDTKKQFLEIMKLIGKNLDNMSEREN